MKKTLLYIVLVLVGSTGIIFILRFLGQPEIQNGFDRNIKPLNWTLGKMIALPSKSLVFINSTPSTLNLQDFSNPNFLFTVDYFLSTPKKIDLRLPLIIGKKQVNVGMLDSIIYITNGLTDTMGIASLKTNQREYLKLASAGLNQLNPISRISLIAREAIIRNNSPKRRISKISLLNKPTIVKSSDLDRQIDEYFSNDGLLKYDQKNAKLVYAYFYRGEFLSLDTNLNLLYRAKTIDTVRFAKIKLAKDSKQVKDIIKNSITQATPPHIVNRNYTLYNDLIFIISGLKADNEDYSNFRNNQVIDVYRLDNGKYSYSFYVPKYKGYKLRDFQIKDNRIVGIYNNFLVTYTVKNKFWH